jgi:hypothetical protein
MPTTAVPRTVELEQQRRIPLAALIGHPLG